MNRLFAITILFLATVSVAGQVSSNRVVFTPLNPPTVCTPGKIYTNSVAQLSWLGASDSSCKPYAMGSGLANNAPSGNLPVSAGAATLNDSGIAATKGTANNLTITGGAANNSVTISATGSDAKVDLKLAQKGLGNVNIPNGPLIVGAATQSSFIPNTPLLIVEGSDLAPNPFTDQVYFRTDDDAANGLIFMTSGGTLATPTASDPSFASAIDWAFRGFDGTNYQSFAIIRAHIYSVAPGIVTGAINFKSDVGELARIENGMVAATSLGYFAAYNTAVNENNPLPTTDFERGVMKWDTNVLHVGAEKGGTGTLRNVSLDGTAIVVPSLSASQAVFTDASKNLVSLTFTNTPGGTTGAQTINQRAGSVNFAAAATSLVVTNSLVTSASIIMCTVSTNDTTLKSVQCVPGSGSFTMFANAAAAAETRVSFFAVN